MNGPAIDPSGSLFVASLIKSVKCPFPCTVSCPRFLMNSRKITIAYSYRWLWSVGWKQGSAQITWSLWQVGDGRRPPILPGTFSKQKPQTEGSVGSSSCACTLKTCLWFNASSAVYSLSASRQADDHIPRSNPQSIPEKFSNYGCSWKHWEVNSLSSHQLMNGFYPLKRE